MPTKLKATKRAPGAAYGSTGPKGRARRRSLRTDAGKLKAQTSRQKVKKKAQHSRRTGAAAAASGSGSARGSPARSIGPNGGASDAAAESPAVRAEILRLKREIATRNEEISDAVQVLKKSKVQLKSVAGQKRLLRGDKTQIAELSNQIKALGSRILDLSEEHRSLSAVKHSQQFAIRRLKDDARDYVERFQSLKEEQKELKRQSHEERQRRQERGPAYAKAARKEDELRRQIGVLERQLARDQDGNDPDSPSGASEGGGSNRDGSSFAIQKYRGKKSGNSPSNSNKKSPTRAEKLEAERQKKASVLERRIEILEHEIMKDQKRQASKLRKKKQEFDDLEEQQAALQAKAESLQAQLAQADQLGATLISQIKSFKMLSQHPEETDLFKKKNASSFAAQPAEMKVAGRRRKGQAAKVYNGHQPHRSSSRLRGGNNTSVNSKI